MIPERRRLLLGAAAALMPRWLGAQPAVMRVVIVGGGFGGATCARYLKLWSGRIDVTLIEPQSVYVACPLSNRVLGGAFYVHDLARDYGGLTAGSGVRVVRATAVAIDAQKRSLRLSDGSSVPWDRLVLAPGIEFDAERIDGLPRALDSGAVLHAWRGGSQQISRLRARIADMPAGGVVAIHIPKAPYRCPPGPYERASLIAHFLSRNNPKAKLLIFDSNPDIQSKRGLFLDVWKSRYAGIVEYTPDAELLAVPNGRELRFAMHGTVRADVINVIPPQRAPALLRRAGLSPSGGAWCPVEFLGYESTLVPGVHVVGDAILSAPGLPKSGHMANQAGKVCAGAIVAAASGRPPSSDPVIANTCYSFVSAQEAMHVAGVYRYDPQQRTMVAVKGAGGISQRPSAAEGVHAIGWAFNILHDTFGSTFTTERAF